MAIRPDVFADVKQDLYDTIPGDGAGAILVGSTSPLDINPTFWRYDANSSAIDNYANGVIQPTLQTGNGRWIRFNPNQVQADWAQSNVNSLDYIKGKPATAKRQITYLGTTSGTAPNDGIFSVTYSPSFSATPDVQPQLVAGTPSQVVRIISSTTTGFSVQVTNRASTTLLGLELLLAATTNVNNASVSVLVTER